jgi:hypothetical protein
MPNSCISTLRSATFVAFLCLSAWVQAQSASFILVSDSVGINSTFSALPAYASGLSLRDFNRDGWDDLVMCTDGGSQLKVYMNTYGYFNEVDLQLGGPSHDRFTTWVDYDNDGILDFFKVSDTSGVYLLKGDSNGTFTSVTNTVGLGGLNGIVHEGALFADFNNDGLLDLHVASHNMVTPNRLFFQTPNHHFEDISASSGACDSLDITFFAVAIDYNQDGWMDFYEANDAMTGNLMYKNNGDSTFTEVSHINGTYHELNAMGLGVGDYDGDADLDIHVTGRSFETILLRNNGDGTFSEVGEQHNLHYPTGFGWGNIFFDAEFDGDNDLYVSGINVPFQNGMPSILYLNDGSAYFDNDTLEGDSIYSFSNSVFDFNNDRLHDLASLNSANNPSSVWLNTSSVSTPRFSIQLQGCYSNRDAFGAKIYAYDGGEKRVWMKHSVQSYTAQSGDREIIPILNGPTLDSLQVIWPLGNDTVLYNIKPDQTITLDECGSAEPFPVILVDDYLRHELVLCPQSEIILRLDGKYESVLWSDGSTTDSIVVASPGVYDVTVTNQFGYSSSSTKPVVVSAKLFPDFMVDVQQPNCFNNGRLEILPTDPNNNYIYTWNNGAVVDSLIALEPGEYVLTVTNGGHCPVIDTFILQGPDSLNPISVTVDFDAIPCYGDSTTVTLTGEGGYGALTYTWSIGVSGNVQMLPAGQYALTVTDPNNCEIDTTFTLTQPSELFVWAEAIPDTNRSGVGIAWVEIDGGTAPYSIQWNDSLLQTTDTAYNLSAGDYEAYVEDAYECIYTRSIRVKNQVVIGEREIHTSTSLRCKSMPGGVLLEGLKGASYPIEVYDLTGKPSPFSIEQLSPTSSRLQMDVPGLYLIRLDDRSVCKVLQY